jgi:hypothetical protein
MATKKASTKGGAKKGGSKKGGSKKGGAKKGGKRGLDFGAIASGVGNIAAGIGAITGTGRKDLRVAAPKDASLKTINDLIARKLGELGCRACRSGIDRIVFEDIIAGR